MAITVSVIVPVYNVEALLSKCLDSIIAQTLDDIEIICVNDASPDNSIDILRQYEAKHNNIKVIDLKENIRQGGARNRGIEAAQGEYIAFVDSDDYVDSTMFEKLYKKAKVTDADVVSSGYYVVNSVTGDCMSRFPIDFDKYYISGYIDANKRKQLINNIGSVWLMIYRTSMLKDHNIRFPEHMFYEDTYFIPVCMLYVKRFEYVSDYLYYYCNNPDATTTKRNNFKGFAERHISLDMTMNFLRNHLDSYGNDARPIDSLEMMLVNNSLNMYLTTFDLVKLEELKKLRKYLSIRKILNINTNYNTETTNLVILKVKIRLLTLLISSRLFKAVFCK